MCNVKLACHCFAENSTSTARACNKTVRAHLIEEVQALSQLVQLVQLSSGRLHRHTNFHHHSGTVVSAMSIYARPAVSDVTGGWAGPADLAMPCNLQIYETTAIVVIPFKASTPALEVPKTELHPSEPTCCTSKFSSPQSLCLMLSSCAKSFSAACIACMARMMHQRDIYGWIHQADSHQQDCKPLRLPQTCHAGAALT